MNTLRAKIAVLLVVAIVSVVGLLTVVLFYLLGPPKHRHSLTPVAQQVETLERIVKEGKSDVLMLVPEPRAGPRLCRLDRALARLARGTRAHACRHHHPRWLGRTARRLDPGRRARLAADADLRFAAARRAVERAVSLACADHARRHGHRRVRGEPHGAAAGSARECRRVGRARRHALPVLPERGPAEVRATARALNSLSSRLKRAIESRMRLVAAAGHDLRTPITRMRLRAEFVEDEEERELWLTRPRRARAHRRQRDPPGARGIGQGAPETDAGSTSWSARSAQSSGSRIWT